LGGLIGSTTKMATGDSLDLSSGVMPSSSPTDFQSLLKRYQQGHPCNVWILIDDVDAKFVDTEEQHQRVGAFLSAIRSLAFNVQGLRIRASIRVDVLTNLRHLEDADKLRQYIKQITWSDEALKKIFTKKILSYFKRVEPQKYVKWSFGPENYKSIASLIFGRNFSMYRQADVDPLNVIMSLAGKRPRWIGQICKLAGNAAGTGLVEQRHFESVMQDFGQAKLSDLCKEHAHQFADISKLTEAFRHSEKELSRFKLISLIEKRYISKVGSGNVPHVNGFEFKDAAQLGEFLFKIDFITGKRVGDRWVAYFQEPMLFESHQNEQNKISWCVNLSYRGYLHIA